MFVKTVANNPTKARRIPLQTRSRERVERILDAAAQEFIETGYDASTTEAIAERAGTSIGSLYQFFPNKASLFDAMASRYLEQAAAIFEGLMSPALVTMPWERLLDTILDTFAAFHRSDPSFRAVLLNWRLSVEFLAAGDALNREFARRGEMLLAAHAPALTSRQRSLVATMLVEIMSAMQLVAVRRDHSTADGILAETKILLRRYLKPYANMKRPPQKTARKSAGPLPPKKKRAR
jgi:AcrR family transcriptional regulator